MIDFQKLTGCAKLSALFQIELFFPDFDKYFIINIIVRLIEWYSGTGIWTLEQKNAKKISRKTSETQEMQYKRRIGKSVVVHPNEELQLRGPMLLSDELLNFIAFFCSNVHIPVPEYHSISLRIILMIECLSKSG